MEAEEGMEGGTAPPVTDGLVLAAAAGGELGGATADEALGGALVLAVRASRVEVELNVGAAAAAAASPPAALMLGVEVFGEVTLTGPESECEGGAAGGFAAGWVELAGVEVFVVGTDGAARGGVEDLGLSDGDEAPKSSTGLVLFLWDLLFSPPFFFPPSLCIPG